MSIVKTTGFLQNRNRPLRAIGLGDSITAYDSAVSANGIWHLGNSYWENLIRSTSGQGNPQFTFVRNAGVPGNTTPQMLARLQTDVLAYAPDVVFLMAGTNDILPGATNANYVTFFNALEKIIIRLLNAGVDVVLSTMPAKNGAELEVRTAMPWYYLLASYYNIPLIDAFRVTVDPHTGSYLSGYTSDGTHPNDTGIAAIVAEGISVLQTYKRPVYRAAVSESVLNSTPNLIRNGTFANITVPPAPDYWTINTSGATYALTPDPVAPATPSNAHYAGNAFVYTKTAAGGAYALFGGGTTGGFADGDTLVLSGQLSSSGLSAASGFSFLLDMAGDSAQPIAAHKTNNDFQFSEEIIVPTGYSSHTLTPQLFVQDVGVYTVKEVTLWNKSAYQAIWQPGNLLNS